MKDSWDRYTYFQPANAPDKTGDFHVIQSDKRPMTFNIIVFTVLSGLAGVKKPIWGAIVGTILAPALSIIHMSFDLPTVFMLTPFGFGFGLLIGVSFWNIFHGKEYNKQNWLC